MPNGTPDRMWPLMPSEALIDGLYSLTKCARAGGGVVLSMGVTPPAFQHMLQLLTEHARSAGAVKEMVPHEADVPGCFEVAGITVRQEEGG